MSGPIEARVPAARRLFHDAGGPDRTTDRAPEFDIARYDYEQRYTIAQDAMSLRTLMTAIDGANELSPAQWTQFYSVALGFKPDLIVELGRGKGNSTALFCQAAARLPGTRVISLCNSTHWTTETLPKLTALVKSDWAAPLDARIVDIMDVDYARLFTGFKRVLLLWDAHGFEIAETVLGRIMPTLERLSHLVLMHDISDNRYCGLPRSYDGEPLWKGSTWDKGAGRSKAYVHIGWMTSIQDQIIAISDFAARNDIEIGSADHEYAQFFDTHPEAADSMRRDLGDLFSTSAHWAFLSLTGKQTPFHFPAVQRRFRHRADVDLNDIQPARGWFGRSHPLPRQVDTSAVPWAYALVTACRPRTDVPTDAGASLRVRLRVDGGPAGVGLLKADHSTFIGSHRVLSASDAETVFLPWPADGTAGPLVVHAWDRPEPARVIVEEVAIVW